MSRYTTDERTLALIAEGVLDASDEEIMRVANEHGINVVALERKVRTMIADRIAAAEQADRVSFTIGETVALRSDPSRIGVITSITPSNREVRYGVFIDGRMETLYASQLAPAQIAARMVRATLEELNARLTALQLVAPSLANLYSLQAGRIDFIPYQFRPVLKFIRADRPRLLVADEVGVGKTIEAGLLLRELQARRPLRSVLVVCSKTLVVEEKWHREMRRFDEEFVTLSSVELRHCLDQTDLDGEWPERYARSVLPFSLVNDNLLNGYAIRGGQRSKGLTTLDSPPRFDLLIVDEAHNARNSETNLHQGLKLLADNAEAVVLITATPIQLGTSDLFSLLNLLRPDLVIDKPTFERMAQPNAAINAAIAVIRGGQDGWQAAALDHLSEAAATDWGQAMLGPSPEYRALIAAIGDANDDEARVRLVHRAEGLHSFASLISRTRRRDIGAFTTRKPQTVSVPFTPAQQAVHDAVLTVQREVYMRTHGSGPLGFLMTTIRRQTASSLHGLVPFLETILTRRLSEIERAEIDDDAVEMLDTGVDDIRAEISAVLTQARALPAEDPKLDRLLAIVAQKGEMANRRLLLFSAFRHTLAYLEAALRSHGVRVGLIHGDVGDDDRRALRRAFALPPDNPSAIDVLLSSEVGSEGLDFQFCDALVNYDIPWNPMRIEQRIGRIDRYGQTSETVAIYNLVTPGTVDFDIYSRCLLRIGIFERAIGGSEAILGEIATRLQQVAEDFSLTEDERNDRLQQLADNEIREIAETEALEEREAELFGVRVARNRIDDDIAQASSRWLEPSALERLVGIHLERTLEVGRNPILGQGAAKTLRLSAEARRRLIPARTRGMRPSLAEREWEAWLRGDQATLGLTFERDTANADRSLAFITPVHPLTQAAARGVAADEEIHISLAASLPGLSPGEYPFAIYQWQLSGLKEDAMLVPVVADPEISRVFMHVLAAARDVTDLPPPSSSMIEALDGWHHDLWVSRRAEHVAEAAEIARFRRDSLEASYRARMAILEEQRGRANEERIRRMRTGQIDRAMADHREALARLARDEARADILARRVAAGVIRVEG
ncbi:DEAD/DEAH box helicase [Pelagibacterium luteolum]|uniref:Superfamily II DNA or RNA helicase, SNF2 family n=1 Tax=Pelagibacterium luteolum TaxID=440168 RepID=A0A1G7YPM4_9HYPH|nr:helicase-related protein [Pelagibacterium luteolum]SDG98463.1 Superfamily II DNA or RNA helicase, SNF2 family [Pelagibacterium luteolum]